ncbi:MAG: ribose 5-phosphate isomerase B [Actinobacteria bacterium]|nr:ribose 5-phosphate isomerase B [Actinomycetota bacterium]
MKKRIAIACDDAGISLKEIIKKFLSDSNVEFGDLGIHEDEKVDYPDIALRVARKIADGIYERGILICGTGIGMSIVANKVPGIRAALCHDTYSAERSRKSNDAQIITMGARVIGPELAKKIIDTWLKSEFEGGNSARKVQRIIEIDKDRAI